TLPADTIPDGDRGPLDAYGIEFRGRRQGQAEPRARAVHVVMLCMKQLAALLLICAAASAQRYEANWDSLDKRPVPAWFPDAKFGIFIQWGVYAVPSWAAAGVPKEQQYAEWYWNSITRGKALPENAPGSAAWRFHQRVYGPNFDYAQFAPMFRAEMFE